MSIYARCNLHNEIEFYLPETRVMCHVRMYVIFITQSFISGERDAARRKLCMPQGLACLCINVKYVTTFYNPKVR
jgi:hypothetical protein